MNVASLELCKELYELSGWTGPDKGYAKYGDSYKLENGHQKRGAIPSYDLGYLLRKLPPTYVNNGIHQLTIKVGALGYEHFWFSAYDSALFKRADTPEDAACKLAIELFKQNILTKESN